MQHLTRLFGAHVVGRVGEFDNIISFLEIVKKKQGCLRINIVKINSTVYMANTQNMIVQST